MLDNHEIGLMCQPSSNPPKSGWLWAADNGCFASNFKEDKWKSWLEKPHPRAGCLFATVPDVVGEHDSTMLRWRKLNTYVRSLGYPVAFVAQDGATESNVPWDEMDVLFIGGTTSFKQGMASGILAKAAQEKGKWVHVGRVNSMKRLMHWSKLAHSSDGTHLAYGPSKKVAEVKRWVESLRMATQLSVLEDSNG